LAGSALLPSNCAVTIVGAAIVSTYSFVVRSLSPTGAPPRVTANAESAALRCSMTAPFALSCGPPSPS
jgi:hypothetical protein